MSSLALELKARGITIVDPLEAAALKAKKAEVAFDDWKEHFDFDEEEEKGKSTPKKKQHHQNKSCHLLQQEHQERKKPSKARILKARLSTK
jgi:hypothetical protein